MFRSGFTFMVDDRVDGFHHCRCGSEKGVILGDATRVRLARFYLAHDVEIAAFVQLHISEHERFHARADPTRRAPDALCDGPYLAVLTREHRDNAIRLAQLVGAQHNRMVTVKRHTPLSTLEWPFGPCHA